MEEVKLSLFADDIILYLWDPKNSTKKLLEIIKKCKEISNLPIYQQQTG
jgi:hypothetical protein